MDRDTPEEALAKARRLTLLVCAATVALFASGLWAATALRAAARTERLVAESLRTIDAAEDLYAAMVEAEAGLRGFLLTWDQRLLASTEPLARDLPVLLEDLEQRAAQTASLAARVPALRNQVEAWERHVHHAAGLVQEQQDAARAAAAYDSEGNRALRAMRDGVQAFRDEEQDRLERRIARRRAEVTEAVLALSVTALIALGIALHAVLRALLTARARLRRIEPQGSGLLWPWRNGGDRG